MVIRELGREECLRVLAGKRLARLACARENHPYVVPVYLTYHQRPGDEPCLYGFTTPGQKVEWMRANPLVCVEVDEVPAYDQWVSVIAFGRYEELPEASGGDEERRPALELARPVGKAAPETGGRDDEWFQAWQVLKALPVWWQPGGAAWTARAHRTPAEPFVPVYYRIRIDRVTGHEATRDPEDAVANAAAAPPAG